MAPKKKQDSEEKSDTAIPRFTIDLSLEPEQRYVALAKAYQAQIQRLTALFDELLDDLGVPEGFHKSINRLARLFLRRLHSKVETAELRGISKAAGIPMYLLISLNVILDLLMGCTSGAVRTVDENQQMCDARMLHFRTLDWGMDPLRSVIVQLDYIKSGQSSGAQILGSSITYVGFVGVLTGVRESLSLSLNFRAVHNATTARQQFRFYFHHILVLLGLRQSISSMLRSCLFGHERDWSAQPWSVNDIMDTIPSKHTTAAYLIFCNGQRGISMEKDFCTAVVQQSESFLVTTNHDLKRNDNAPVKTHAAAMQDLLDESEDRRRCVTKKWQSKLRRELRKQQQASKDLGDNGTITRRDVTRSLRSSKVSVNDINSAPLPPPSVDHNNSSTDIDMSNIEKSTFVSTSELIRWTTDFPTSNECTHFAAILDPSSGQVVWSQRYLHPITQPDDETPRLVLGL